MNDCAAPAGPEGLIERLARELRQGKRPAHPQRGRAVVTLHGALVAVVGFVRALPRRDPDAFVPVRLTLGRFLALGLEFQLAADVLRTAISPSFEEIGKLAAIAAIRTRFMATPFWRAARMVSVRLVTTKPAPSAQVSLPGR